MPLATPAAEPAVQPPPPRLWDGASRAFALGAVALVTLGALENRAVGTVLPTLLGEIGSLNSIGLVTAAPLITFIQSMAVAGWWSDRAGPLPVLWAGAVAFAAGQLLVGTAPSLGAVVAGRLLSGLAEGLLDVSLMVLVALALDESLRPKLMALFAAAWVLPSVLGPLAVGAVTEQLGWRPVFLSAVVLLVPTLLALRPAMRRVGALRHDGAMERSALPPLRSVLPWAVTAAAGLVVLNESALIGGSAVVRTGLMAAAVAAVAVAGRRLLPAGTFSMAPGIGGVVVLRAALSAAFMGVGGFLPLVLTVMHGYGPTTAGVSLSVTGVMWSLGSAIQSRLSGRPGLLLKAGFGLLTVGLASSTALVWTDLPVPLGLGGWALAGLGIGMTSSTLAVLTMSYSDATNQGRNNAGAQLAGSMATAMFFAAASAVIATVGQPDRLSLGIITTAAAGVGALGLLGVRRLG